MATTLTAPVQWPSKAWSPDGSDLAEPTRALLKSLDVLPDEEEVRLANNGVGWKTPPSLQVITAGAGSLSKWMSGALVTLGGSSVVLAAVSGFWDSSSDALRTSIALGLAVLLSAVAVAIATIVRSDIRARAVASAAQYEARGAITAAFLEACRESDGKTGGVEVSSRDLVATNGARGGAEVEAPDHNGGVEGVSFGDLPGVVLRVELVPDAPAS